MHMKRHNGAYMKQCKECEKWLADNQSLKVRTNSELNIECVREGVSE